MSSKSRRLWITATLVLSGCFAGANPFIAARFSQGLVGGGAGGGSATQPTGDIDTSCELSDTQNVLNGFLVANGSQQIVSYSLTFLASAGSGGFVCNEDVDDYLNAGYRALPLDSVTRTAIVGCDPIPLQGGTQILALRLSGQIAQNTISVTTCEGLNADAPTAAAPLNGTRRIPLPEVIVLGDDQPFFICTGTNACTQGGFAYVDVAGNLIDKVTASRTQGTLCNLRVTNLPEWRLFDPNFAEAQAEAFNYTAGGIITVVILDRAGNSDPNVNKVVWQVRASGGAVLHDCQD